MRRARRSGGRLSCPARSSSTCCAGWSSAARPHGPAHRLGGRARVSDVRRGPRRREGRAPAGHPGRARPRRAERRLVLRRVRADLRRPAPRERGGGQGERDRRSDAGPAAQAHRRVPRGGAGAAALLPRAPLGEPARLEPALRRLLRARSQELLDQFELRTVPRGTVLLTEREEGKGLFVLLRGRCLAFHTYAAGGRKNYPEMVEGRFFGRFRCCTTCPPPRPSLPTPTAW